MIYLIHRLLRRLWEIPARGIPKLKSATYGDGADGIVWLTHPTSPNFPYGVRYEPCDPGLCDELIRSLDIDYRDWTFFDVGCGKGRALMIAEKYPFKKIIGIEYSKRLAAVAKRLSKGATVVCQDATDYQFPADDKVVFMFHPFGKPVLEKVLQNLCGNVILIYLGVGKEWPKENPLFQAVRRTEHAVIYRLMNELKGLPEAPLPAL
jgi:SAM-dependent methyltransferase